MQSQPLRGPPLEQPEATASANEDAAPPAPRVLVVERRRRPHEPDTRTASRIRAFQPATTVSVAYSGWEALEILRRAPTRFDLVVIDVNAGWMDPVDFVRRAQILNPALPGIIASAIGYGAVLVPSEHHGDEARIAVRQLVRAVLRELRKGSAAERSEDLSAEERPGRGILSANR